MLQHGRKRSRFLKKSSDLFHSFLDFFLRERHCIIYLQTHSNCCSFQWWIYIYFWAILGGLRKPNFLHRVRRFFCVICVPRFSRPYKSESPEQQQLRAINLVQAYSICHSVSVELWANFPADPPIHRQDRCSWNRFSYPNFRVPGHFNSRSFWPHTEQLSELTMGGVHHLQWCAHSQILEVWERLSNWVCLTQSKWTAFRRVSWCHPS